MSPLPLNPTPPTQARPVVARRARRWHWMTDHASPATDIALRNRAARRGVERGDRVLGLDGTGVDTIGALGERLEAVRGEAGIVLSLGRDGRRYDVQVPIGRSGG